MTRRPDSTEPEPPGGRAAERLREFIAQRFPGGLPPQRRAREEAADRDSEQGEERDADVGEERQTR